MKLQDIIFLIILIVLILKQNSKWAAIAGVICLIISIPLFALWIFFTAEHLIWYSFAFFLLSAVLLFKNK